MNAVSPALCVFNFDDWYLISHLFVCVKIGQWLRKRQSHLNAVSPALTSTSLKGDWPTYSGWPVPHGEISVDGRVSLDIFPCTWSADLYRLFRFASRTSLFQCTLDVCMHQCRQRQRCTLSQRTQLRSKNGFPPRIALCLVLASVCDVVQCIGCSRISA